MIAALLFVTFPAVAVASVPPYAQTVAFGHETGTIQRTFNAGRARLLALETQLKLGQATLATLELSAQSDQAALAGQLVGAYESDSAALAKLTPMLVGRVLAARWAEATEAEQLGSLSTRRPVLAKQVASERAQLAQARSSLSRAQGGGGSASQPEDVADGQPASAQSSAISALPADLAGKERGVAAGAMAFPIPRSDTSPPMTWSLTDSGVDIAAPAGTPELAACDGTIVLHGIGEFGPSTPVVECDSQIAGNDYLYYGDAGPTHLTPIGTHVTAGQVISQVGPGTVGDSTGPNLEIGFADASGAPLSAASAPKVMALLRAAYRS